MGRSRSATVLVMAALAVLAGSLPAAATHPIAIGCHIDGSRMLFLSDLPGSEHLAVPIIRTLETGCAVGMRRQDVGTAALAPDGEHVAVSVVEGGRSVLRLLQDEHHVDRPLTAPPEGFGDSRPAWSPDGRTVLFVRASTTDERSPAARALFSVPATGGAAVEVPGTRGALSGSYDPTGRRIVFDVLTSGRAGDEQFEPEEGALVIAETDGSGRRDLAVAGVDPVWSPDGQRIAFVVTTKPSPGSFIRAERQIATVDAAGGDVRLLAATAHGSGAWTRQPAWAPDGRSLVYSLRRSGLDGRSEPGDIYAVDVSGRRSGPVVADPARDERYPTTAGPRPAPVAGAQPSTFTPVAPRRVLDTRTGLGGRAGRVTPTSPVRLGLRDEPTSAGALPATATAVVLNVTVTAPSESTHVSVVPGDGSPHGSSSLNASAGATVPNLVTVALGQDGSVLLSNAAGAAHLIADLAGWYAPTGDGLAAQSVAPRRILDTRSGLGAAAGRIGPERHVDLQVTGTLPHADGGTVVVPDTARAVVITLTATGASASTDVRAYPTPAQPAVPVVSNLNLRRGQTAANLVTVAVSDSGKVRLRNADGDVHLIADIAGWYAADATDLFVPATPSRVLDTRAGNGAAPTPVGAAQDVDIALAGARGIPAAATAVVVNLTGTGATASTDIRAYPSNGDGGPPTVSNLNLTRGATRATLALVRTGELGQVRVRNAAGQVHLLADLAGWFVPRTTTGG